MSLMASSATIFIIIFVHTDATLGACYAQKMELDDRAPPWGRWAYSVSHTLWMVGGLLSSPLLALGLWLRFSTLQASAQIDTVTS